ncbi:hypothetical protein SAMN04488036_102314 [Shimia haliotis]|uniref:Recombinase XerC n=2 Tax=Shimia haliotis TaxID=1280847 RepID=A0A1I4CJ58_9RHOB|nr:hypothetical protein SAMN04488036_102314 [Shimia haliotis]
MVRTTRKNGTDMSSTPQIDDTLRDKIISSPNVILEDRDLMRALIAANEKTMGGNIVDLRGIAMERLEARLDRLEDTHRSVIAAAYDNLAGTNQVHRAILRMLDPVDFESFLRDLGSEVADILRVDSVRLVLETDQDASSDANVQKLGDVLCMAESGFVDGYLTGGRAMPARQVTLRQLQTGAEMVYGEDADWIRSEACLRLDLGEGRLPGLLVMGAEDPHQFTPQQGTDLLAFFAGVFERAMRRWLS